MFDTIFAKIKGMYQHAQDRKEFTALVFQAVADGRLSPSELSDLSTKLTQYQLTDDDLSRFRAKAYAQALRAARSNGSISEGEEVELQRIQTFLRIPDEEISTSKRELARLRLLNQIQAGCLPTVSVSNVILHKAETAHWHEQADLLEERVVARRYEGGSQGVSIRIMKGVTYRIGASRGQLVADKRILPVSNGALVVTNQRVIFSGNAKSFALNLDKILDVEPFTDGLKLSDEKGKSRVLKYKSSENSDVVAAILSHAINNYST